MADVKCVLFHDNFQNFKGYSIPKAQLVIADIPYNIGTDFYASRPDWYVDGNNKNGESTRQEKRHSIRILLSILRSISPFAAAF